MNPESENQPVFVPTAEKGDSAAARERIAERISFLFRQTGDNSPALELKQQIMTYRLLGLRQ